MPFPYHNTSFPTAGSKNNINDIAVSWGIRDFLLSKNIINPIRYPFLSTSINGAPRGGEPVLDTMQGLGNIIQHVSIEVDGIAFKEDNISINRYKNNQINANDLTSIELTPYDTGLFPNTTIPNGIDAYPTSAPTDWDYGILAKSNEKEYRKKATLKNLYLDASKQVDIADYISLQSLDISNQINGYIDEYGALNTGNGGAIRAADIIGSVLNGQGLGFTKSGVVPNFDFRTSLASRVLGATGLINDTKLGLIGGQQLALALANNAAFNLQQNTIGHLNLNPISLLKGNSFIVPSYNITVPASTGGKVLDYAARILGFTYPKSYLNSAGSIFTTENGSVANIQRANSMLENTGKGQANILLGLMNNNLEVNSVSGFRNGYAPGFNGYTDVYSTEPFLYAFSTDNNKFIQNFIKPDFDVIPDLNFNREKLVKDSGFDDFGDSYAKSTVKTPTFTWGTNTDGGLNNVNGANVKEFTNTKSLIAKTQKIFDSVKMKNIVSSKGMMGVIPSQIQTAVVGGGISKGNAVKSAKALSTQNGGDLTAEETYCRAWTTLDRYDTVNKLVRHAGLNQNSEGGEPVLAEWRPDYAGSVLDDNGFVKIAPYKNDNLTRESARLGNPKKYMLSIENLAWAGGPALNLPPSEQGPGDLISGKFGRIMWFPPYDINFTENNTGNWESTNFIGRGEPIYTYNNAERTGTLSFKIIIDHPSSINGMQGSQGPEDDYIDSYFAGCVDLDDKWAKNLTTQESSVINVNKVTQTQKQVQPDGCQPDPFEIYFSNDNQEVPLRTETGRGYEDGVGVDESNTPDSQAPVSTGLGATQGNKVVSPVTQVWPDSTNFGLNKNFYSIVDNKAELKTQLEQCKTCVVEITGFVSSSGNKLNPQANRNLSKYRAELVKKWFIENGIAPDEADLFKIKIGGVTGPPSTDNIQEVELESFKSARVAKVRFLPNARKSKQQAPVAVTKEGTQATTVSTKIKNRYYTEANFFEKLNKEDPFVFDSIKQKIRYFHPAFHSTTPEGFNARLTFLNQCVRQGPTFTTPDKVDNLVFGAPPVCILRVGDFYNTKIIIDNIGYDFEPLVWDLNPEGVGVQPMIANVNISFKFIGGSALKGPLNKLQNALSFNFFANTHVYDARADSIVRDKTKDSGEKDDLQEIIGYKIKNGLNIVKESMNFADETTHIDYGEFVPDVDQVAENDITTGPNSPTAASTPSISGDPKITGFVVNTDNQYGSTGKAWIIRFHINTENVDANNSDALEPLANKSVKVVIDNQLGSRYEEVFNKDAFILYAQTYSATLDNTNNSGENGILKTNLPSDGPYQISLFVDGLRIASQNITLTV